MQSTGGRVQRGRHEPKNGIPGMLYRLLWLVLDEHADFIPLRVNERRMPTSVRFAEQFPHV